MVRTATKKTYSMVLGNKKKRRTTWFFRRCFFGQHGVSSLNISANMICSQIKRGTTWFFKVALLKSNMQPACSSAEQHAAPHVLLQSNMPPGMLFFCRATCRSVCSLDLAFVLTTDVCFFCVTTEWCFIWKRHSKLNHMYLFAFCMTDRQIKK